MSERRKKRKVYFILYRIRYTHKKKIESPIRLCLFDVWVDVYVKNESVERTKKEKKRFNMSFECVYTSIFFQC
jgi:hypothetical protein